MDFSWFLQKENGVNHILNKNFSVSPVMEEK